MTTAPVWLPLAVLLAGIVFGLVLGLPMAFTLGSASVIAAWLFIGPECLSYIAQNTYGMARNLILIAMPLFIFMACVLERSGVADALYSAMHQWVGPLRGGLAMGTVLICTVIAAMSGVTTTGVVTMGLIALPIMLERGYDKSISIGPILAGGALGILIPPSCSFIVYGMLTRVSIGRLFAGGIIPGLILSFFYVSYIGIRSFFQPKLAPALPKEERVSFRQKIALSRGLVLPVLLVVGVLGSIFLGIASPSEAAAIGAGGAIISAAIYHKLNWKMLKEACYRTMAVNGMIMWILFGAFCFSSVFIKTGGSAMVKELVLGLELAPFYVVLMMMLIYFVMGCFVDEITIVMITLPIFVPILNELGFSLLWFGVIWMINMQMAYLTPPFGFTLFYMKGVAPKGVTMGDIYRSIIPFIPLQWVALLLVMFYPQLALWLPDVVFKLM